MRIIFRHLTSTLQIGLVYLWKLLDFSISSHASNIIPFILQELRRKNITRIDEDVVHHFDPLARLCEQMWDDKERIIIFEMLYSFMYSGKYFNFNSLILFLLIIFNDFKKQAVQLRATTKLTKLNYHWKY